MTVMPNVNESGQEENEEFMINQENEEESEPAEEGGLSNQENTQIVINSGDAYQRVTVVPADANSGELSYVLIVQQPDELKDGEQTDGDQDMTGNLKTWPLNMYFIYYCCLIRKIKQKLLDRTK